MAQTDLGGAGTDLGGAESDLGVAQTDLGGAQTDLGVAQTDLGGAETDLGRAEIDLGRFSFSLSASSNATCASNAPIRIRPPLPQHRRARNPPRNPRSTLAKDIERMQLDLHAPLDLIEERGGWGYTEDAAYLPNIVELALRR